MNHPSLFPVADMQFLLDHGPDLISSKLREGLLWEEHLLEIIRRFLERMPQDAVFVDIGANLGSITVPVGAMMRQRGGGRVYAVEAQRTVFYQLCGNIYVNRLSAFCYALHVALSDREGQIALPVLDYENEKNVGAFSIDPEIRAIQSRGGLTSSDTGSSAPHEQVALRTLDSLNLPPAHLVKLDVEGMEWEVVRGGLRWLEASGWPVLLFEVWADQHMPLQVPKKEALFALLRDAGYELFVLNDFCIAQHRRYFVFHVQKHEDHIHVGMEAV